MNKIEKSIQISARDVVMGVMHAKIATSYSVAQLIQAGEVFEIDSSAMRAAITRLTHDGELKREGRGVYSVGEGGQALHQRVLSWRHVNDLRCEWNGGWQMVVSCEDAHQDRAIWIRTCDRLSLEGFVEASSDIWVRPDNLPGGVDATRERLYDLQASEALCVFRADYVDQKTREKFIALWDVPALLEMHTRLSDKMRKMMDDFATIDQQNITTACRHSLLLVRHAIQVILHDPKLPVEFCPQQDLQDLVNNTREFDRFAKQIWLKYMGCAVPLR